VFPAILLSVQLSWISDAPRVARSWASDALINRNYGLFLGGSFISALGSWFQNVALGWLVLELDNSPFALGLTNFALMVPLFLFGLIGGAIADRVDRRQLILLAGAGMAFFSGVLALLTLLGVVTIPIIVGLALLMGFTNAFMWPAWAPFIKDLVGADKLRSAIAVNAARFNLTRVLGPAIAGWFLVIGGIAFCLMVSTVFSLALLVAVYLIRVPAVPRPPSVPLLPALKEGLVYSWQNPLSRRLLAATAVLGFLAMPYVTFLPAFARNVFEAGPQGLGLLLAAGGAGAIVGAIASGFRSISARPGRAMVVFIICTSVGLTIFGLSAGLVTGLPALALVGFGSIGFLSTANASLQLGVPDHLVGRVMGLWVVMNAGTMPLGSLALGAVADLLDVRTVVLIGSAGALAAAVILSGQRFQRSKKTDMV
jgi:MFS family permease